ncbi:MAG: polysaccharide pyruvyl transferase family protein, partial [Cyclobacteriaceae bacterium]
NLIKKLQTADLVLDVNEGDSYSDIYGLKRFVRHYLDTRICLKLNKRLIFLPQTIGPFSKPILRYLAAGQLKKLEKVYVRDDKAFPFLKKNNISFEKYVDLAVYMSNKPVEYNLPKGEIIGININGLMYLSRYKSLKGQFDAYKNFVNKMIQSFIDLNHTVLLIPHTYNADDPILEDDLSAIIQISNDFNSNKVIYVERNMDAQELKYLISKCSFFVGSRMHSCIAALSSQVPTVGVAYSYKFEGTFANFGMASHVLNMAGIREEEAIVNLDKILSLYHNRSETREILKNYAKSINRPVI